MAEMDWRKRNLNEVFISVGTGKRGPMKSSKKRPAPAPPFGPVQLPKIGNYKPKMIFDPTGPKDSSFDRKPREENRNHAQDPPKPKKDFYIMGDKNVPLIIENESIEEMPVPKPRRKRQVPLASTQEPSPEKEIVQNGDSRSSTQINSVHQNSTNETNDFILEPPAQFSSPGRLAARPVSEMEIIPAAGNIKNNPLFGTSVNDVQPIIQPPMEFMDTSSSNEKSIQRGDSRRKENVYHEIPADSFEKDDAEYPYIPPPDYDEEEKIMDFDDDAGDYRPYHTRRTPDLYRKMEGDDFGKYISEEEDYEFDSHPMSSRRGKLQKRKQAQPKPSKIYKQAGNSTFKMPNKKKEGLYMRSTIRDFAYSDSKIGWGDRTTKSTSAKGRYIKKEREKDRKKHENKGFYEQTPDTYEEFLKSREMGDYENFLHSRSKSVNDLESPNSSDSGHETGDDAYRESVYYRSQPKDMRDKHIDSKSTFWKKLTWKFKKNFGVQQLGNR